MTSSYELDMATEDTWARFVTAAAESIHAIEATAVIGGPGERTRPWQRAAGAEVPAGLWDALAEVATRRGVVIAGDQRTALHEAVNGRVAAVVLERPGLLRAEDAAAVGRLAERLVALSVTRPGIDVGTGTPARFGFLAMVADTAGRIVVAACNVRTNPYRVIEGWDTDWRTRADAVELRQVGKVALRHAHALYAEITDPVTASASDR